MRDDTRRDESMVMMALEGFQRALQVEETREASKKKGSISQPMLVNASLIEKAQDKHDSSNLTIKETW